MKKHPVISTEGRNLNCICVLLNPLEGYIKMAKGLDIQASDFGLKQAREGISGKNPEVTISGLKSLTVSLNRNKAALEAVGYKATVVDEITAFITEITELNEQQNVLKNKRSRPLDEIIKESSALWEIMNTVMNDARAIFRGVEEVKLREYTFSAIKKRVQATTPTTDEKPEETPE